MNGNGELTETENVIFYVSYGVLTELLRMNVFLTHFAAATATVTAKDMECWKSGIWTAIWLGMNFSASGVSYPLFLQSFLSFSASSMA